MMSSPPRAAEPRRRLVSLSLILAAGCWAYHNSFAGVFLFDDKVRIVENLLIRHLWPPGAVLASAMRPLTDFSFALNYALGGLDVWGYHAVNLAIHLLAGLTLFGMVRLTLLTEPLRARYGHASGRLALVVALAWLVHPLHTQAVTYIVQRAESLMGLWYLLTLYGVIRGAGAPSPRGWYTVSMVSCAMGMLSKTIMVTAPLMVLLYDRVFLAGSCRQAWRQRHRLYLALAATWILPAALAVWSWSMMRDWNVGFHVQGISPLGYLLTQPGVLVHYLKLSVWPSPLIFDYHDWPIAGSVEAILPPAFVIATLALATLWAWRHRPPLGFLGAWFFLILAPTSGLIPIGELVDEYRMYLPLAAIICLFVMGGYGGLRRFVSPARVRRGLAAGLVVTLVATLGGLTVRRNEAYHDEIALWQDTLSKRPHNARAHTYLAAALADRGRLGEAMAHYAEALRLRPDFEEAHNAFGNALIQDGRRAEAIVHYREAIRLRPDYAAAYSNLGAALLQEGAVAQAIDHLTEALRLKPGYATAHNNLGNALVRNGASQEAIAHYREALRLKPDYEAASRNLARALGQHPNVTPNAPVGSRNVLLLDR